MRGKLIFFTAVLFLCSLLTGCGIKVDYKDKEYGFVKYYDINGKAYNSFDELSISKDKGEKALIISRNINFALDEENRLYKYKLTADEKGNFSAACELILPDGVYFKDLISIHKDNKYYILVLDMNNSLYQLNEEYKEGTKILDNVSKIEKAKDAVGDTIGLAIVTSESNYYGYVRSMLGDRAYKLQGPISGVKDVFIKGQAITVTFEGGINYSWFGADAESALIGAPGQIAEGQKEAAEKLAQAEYEKATAAEREADQNLYFNSKVSRNCWSSSYEGIVKALTSNYTNEGILTDITLSFANPMKQEIYYMDAVYELYDKDNKFISTVHERTQNLTSPGASTTISMQDTKHWKAYKFKLVKLILTPNSGGASEEY